MFKLFHVFLSFTLSIKFIASMTSFHGEGCVISPLTEQPDYISEDAAGHLLQFS